MTSSTQSSPPSVKEIKYDPFQDPKLETKLKTLGLLTHAANCKVLPQNCSHKQCKLAKAMLQHIVACKDVPCKAPFCAFSKFVLRHGPQIKKASEELAAKRRTMVVGGETQKPDPKRYRHMYAPQRLRPIIRIPTTEERGFQSVCNTLNQAGVPLSKKKRAKLKRKSLPVVQESKKEELYEKNTLDEDEESSSGSEWSTSSEEEEQQESETSSSDELDDSSSSDSGEDETIEKDVFKQDSFFKSVQKERQRFRRGSMTSKMEYHAPSSPLASFSPSQPKKMPPRSPPRGTDILRDRGPRMPFRNDVTDSSDDEPKGGDVKRRERTGGRGPPVIAVSNCWTSGEIAAVSSDDLSKEGDKGHGVIVGDKNPRASTGESTRPHEVAERNKGIIGHGEIARTRPFSEDAVNKPSSRDSLPSHNSSEKGDEARELEEDSSSTSSSNSDSSSSSSTSSSSSSDKKRDTSGSLDAEKSARTKNEQSKVPGKPLAKSWDDMKDVGWHSVTIRPTSTNAALSATALLPVNNKVDEQRRRLQAYASKTSAVTKLKDRFEQSIWVPPDVTGLIKGSSQRLKSVDTTVTDYGASSGAATKGADWRDFTARSGSEKDRPSGNHKTGTLSSKVTATGTSDSKAESIRTRPQESTSTIFSNSKENSTLVKVPTSHTNTATSTTTPISSLPSRKFADSKSTVEDSNSGPPSRKDTPSSIESPISIPSKTIDKTSLVAETQVDISNKVDNSKYKEILAPTLRPMKSDTTANTKPTDDSSDSDSDSSTSDSVEERHNAKNASTAPTTSTQPATSQTENSKPIVKLSEPHSAESAIVRAAPTLTPPKADKCNPPPAVVATDSDSDSAVGADSDDLQLQVVKNAVLDESIVLVEDKADLKATITSLQSQLKEARELIASLTMAKAAQDESLKVVSNERDSYKSAMEATKAELAQSSHSCMSLKQQLSDIELANRRAMDEKRLLTQENAGLKRTMAALKKQLEDASSRVLSMQQFNESYLKSLKSAQQERNDIQDMTRRCEVEPSDDRKSHDNRVNQIAGQSVSSPTPISSDLESPAVESNERAAVKVAPGTQVISLGNSEKLSSETGKQSQPQSQSQPMLQTSASSTLPTSCSIDSDKDQVEKTQELITRSPPKKKRSFLDDSDSDSDSDSSADRSTSSMKKSSAFDKAIQKEETIPIAPSNKIEESTSRPSIPEAKTKTEVVAPPEEQPKQNMNDILAQWAAMQSAGVLAATENKTSDANDDKPVEDEKPKERKWKASTYVPVSYPNPAKKDKPTERNWRTSTQNWKEADATPVNLKQNERTDEKSETVKVTHRWGTVGNLTSSGRQAEAIQRVEKSQRGEGSGDTSSGLRTTRDKGNTASNAAITTNPYNRWKPAHSTTARGTNASSTSSSSSSTTPAAGNSQIPAWKAKLQASQRSDSSSGKDTTTIGTKNSAFDKWKVQVDTGKKASAKDSESRMSADSKTDEAKVKPVVEATSKDPSEKATGESEGELDWWKMPASDDWWSGGDPDYLEKLVMEALGL